MSTTILNNAADDREEANKAACESLQTFYIEIVEIVDLIHPSRTLFSFTTDEHDFPPSLDKIERTEYDICVIGAGPAGEFAFGRQI